MTSVNDNAGPPPIGALTISGFCKLYNIGRTHLYEEIRAGRLTARKTGKRSLILRSEADRWANALPVLGAR
jgi:excisionase family DNA binding protein